MSNEAITWAFKQELPMTDKFVLVALADYADDEGMCYPSHKKTAKRTGASVATVKRATRRLQESGYLDVLPWKRENGSTTSNRYSLKVGVQIDPPVQADTQGGYLSDPGAQVMGDPPINHQLDPSVEPPASAFADDAFARFWAAYPKKVSKQGARKVWDRLVKKVDPEEIIRGAETYAQFVKAERTERRFIKGPDGWLNAGKWEDEIEVTTVPVKFDPWSKEAYVA